MAESKNEERKSKRIDVWRIEVTSAERNAYGIDRMENYKGKLDCQFETEAEAREYIKQKTRTHTDTEVPNFLIYVGNGITDPEKVELLKDKFMNEFCFTDDQYMKYRRFFLHKIPWDKVKKALVDNGTQVVKL